MKQIPTGDGAVRTIILTDLDDTLFQTARKLSAEELARSTRAARATNDRHSFITPRQQALFEWFHSRQVIPVTARGCEAYSRVQLPFAGPAIVANGATLLDADGQPDAQWQAHVLALLATHRKRLDGLPALIREEAARRDVAVRTWLVEEPGCGGVYAVAKAEKDASGQVLESLVPTLHATLACGTGIDAWRLHHNGNNLALLPPGVSKAAAAQFLLERLRTQGEVLTIGVGDSASDLEFMRLCDLWMTPTGSAIDQMTLLTGQCLRESLRDAGSHGSLS